MKKIILGYILTFTTFLVTAQTIPLKHNISQPAPSIASLMKSDFSPLFVQTENSSVYGFIGGDYQRLRIKFITVKKGEMPLTFDVYGKSMVKGTMCKFNGKLKIISIKQYPRIAMGVDGKYTHAGIKGEYRLTGRYILREDRRQLHSGIFSGEFKTDFYVDRNNNIKYDNLEIEADGFSNNEFTGKWTSYTSHITKACNWGDFRIPQSGDLDIGAGEFSPNTKYLKNGWQTLRDLLTHDSPAYQNAKETENAKWWK
ncbi:hypothetical protein [Mucilaginibacter sp. L3T2-6]|uniref:hypothetical protein n=1 Tax=Mucilaginibacter sp. L3T2-6 TaxID=3062491 RepID=UPI00267732F3|nr:hypothetical protein [Mucilaginibacter sp. L3T2-6]MDO3642771.1 hypothetical protein [Mucilaginibacter sp. L3T2-6]MDV6215420.1 hypothetical protein [Mucilaginibacter sp. L3T2-6]